MSEFAKVKDGCPKEWARKMCKVVSQIVWVQVGARVLRGNEPVPPSVWPPRAPSLPTMGVRLGLFRAQQAQKFILGLKGVMPTLE